LTAPVLLDHDGALEDFTALLLLLTFSNVDLLGITVTPANCLAEPGVSVTRKILDFADHCDVTTAPGSLDGVNPFPLAWRTDSLKADELPILNRTQDLHAPLARQSAHAYMAEVLQESPEPVTVLEVGPLTNLAWCLENHPELERKISEIVFMGGALTVPGNVKRGDKYTAAEWNVYWDPPAAKRVWSSMIPITLFPLDVTNQVPVTSEFCRALGKQYDYPFSALAGTLWAMSFGTLETTDRPYFCWDSLTTSYLTRPDLFEFTHIRTDVICDGAETGRVVATENGRPVKSAVRADAGGFYDLCGSAFRR
jgi:purine nucleosidase